jgi:hypothetical protein
MPSLDAQWAAYVTLRACIGSPPSVFFHGRFCSGSKTASELKIAVRKTYPPIFGSRHLPLTCYCWIGIKKSITTARLHLQLASGRIGVFVNRVIGGARNVKSSCVRFIFVVITAVITATCGGSASPTLPTFGGQNASANITVTNLSVSAAAASLAVGEITTVIATATYSDGTTATVIPTWSSTDSEGRADPRPR